MYKYSMSRTAPRPHTWKVQGEIPHRQYRCWIQHKNQAQFRGESYNLTFEQYQTLWQEHWDKKGRTIDGYCLTRRDAELPWSQDNTECIPRSLHFKRQGKNKKGKQYGKNN